MSTTVTVVASDMGCFYSGNPNTSYADYAFNGSNPVGANGYRLVAKVDLSSLPQNILCTNAQFVVQAINLTNPAFTDLDAFQLASDWTGPEATWNNRKSGVPWDSPGGDLTSNDFAFVDIGDPTVTTGTRAIEMVNFWLQNPGLNFGWLFNIHMYPHYSATVRPPANGLGIAITYEDLPASGGSSSQFKFGVGSNYPFKTWGK